jgi:hypothetical protein
LPIEALHGEKDTGMLYFRKYQVRIATPIGFRNMPSAEKEFSYVSRKCTNDKELIGVETLRFPLTTIALSRNPQSE